MVAAVIDAESYHLFLEWQRQNQGSINDTFARLRKLCSEEDYLLETPERRNRDNAFINDVLD